MTDTEFDWQRLSGFLADQSKRWWAYAITCQVLVVVISVSTIVLGKWANVSALVAGALAVCYTVIQWRSDRLRRLSDTIRRKFEMLDGLGWPITPMEASDILVAVPRSFRDRAMSTEKAAYFASEEPASSRRLLANLEESAWWTKHLAANMMQAMASICFVAFIVAAVTMVVALGSALSQTTAEIVARTSTSVIVFVFSGGYFRLAFEYNRYSTAAEKIEVSAHAMLKNREITDVEAVKLLSDFQIARAGSASIPTWLWRRRERDLNEVWAKRTQVQD